MPHVLGTDCKIYYDAVPLADGAVSGNWTEITNVKDVTLNLETGEADITTRANSGWQATAATLKNGTVEFDMVWDPTDAAFTAIQAAWAAAGEIAVAVMDGSIIVAGKQGFVANFTVTNFSRSEPLTEAVSVSVTLKPSSHQEWYKVAA